MLCNRKIGLFRWRMDLVSVAYSFIERKLFPFKPIRRRDAVPSCSRGYICNIHPNITKVNSLSISSFVDFPIYIIKQFVFCVSFDLVNYYNEGSDSFFAFEFKAINFWLILFYFALASFIAVSHQIVLGCIHEIIIVSTK